MLIRIKKGRDGADTLSCTRPDGSVTWQRVHEFFPLHDLCHVAVETTLGLEDAFFGLVAQGWDLEDFSAPKATRKPYPQWTVPFEDVVMFFQSEYRKDVETPVDEINALFAALTHPWTITAEQAQEIRLLVRELSRQWEAISPGDSLEVPFPYTSQSLTLSRKKKQTRPAHQVCFRKMILCC